MTALVRLALGFAYAAHEYSLLCDEDVMIKVAQMLNTLVVAFTRAGPHVDISEGCVARKTSWGSFAGRSAICDYPMSSGRHYCEFRLGRASVLGRSSSKTTQGLSFGVISADYDPGSVEVSSYDAAWLYAPVNGNLIHANQGFQWAGQQPAAEGDLIGLLLDLDAGTLTVYLNGTKIGLMVRDAALQRRRNPPDTKRKTQRRPEEHAEEAVPPRVDLRAHLPICEMCHLHPAMFYLPAEGLRRRWCARCAVQIPGAANPHTAQAAGGRAEEDMGMNERLRRALGEQNRQLKERGGTVAALCWCVDLGWESGAVSIKAKGPPG